MMLKTYIVGTMTEAIPLIKKDLGADALILNTKKIKTGGFLGFFQKDKLEVTAAIDPAVKQDAQSQQSELPKPLVTTSEVPEKEAAADLINELKNIKQFMMQQMGDESLPEVLQALKKQLTAQDVAEDVQTELLSKLISRLKDKNDHTSETMQRMAREELIGMIEDNQSPTIAAEPEIICFIGPTGVGKTTSIAKIAADYMLNKDKNMGLITADTYRIAAVEQLKTYGSILNIPVRVVESAGDVLDALEDLRDCDLILMDTAGRNYQQAQYIEELKRLLPAASKIQIHLVLSLTAKYEDMKKIIDNFQSLSMDELLLTKKDETSSLGAVLNLIHHYDIPIRQIANGQNVPNDILAVTPSVVADFILEEGIHA